MKTFICIILTFFVFLFGCAGMFTNSQTGEPYIPEPVSEFAANNVGFMAGISVAKLPVWVDISLRNIYTMATEGSLDVDSINKLLDTFYRSTDLTTQAVANRMIAMAKMLGAVVKDSQIVAIPDLDLKLMTAMAKGYVEGYNLAKEAVQ